jgi:hypothetical protein
MRPTSGNSASGATSLSLFDAATRPSSARMAGRPRDQRASCPVSQLVCHMRVTAVFSAVAARPGRRWKLPDPKRQTIDHVLASVRERSRDALRLHSESPTLRMTSWFQRARRAAHRSVATTAAAAALIPRVTAIVSRFRVSERPGAALQQAHSNSPAGLAFQLLLMQNAEFARLGRRPRRHGHRSSTDTTAAARCSPARAPCRSRAEVARRAGGPTARHRDAARPADAGRALCTRRTRP